MPRIPAITREDLPADQRKHFDAISSERGGVISGPSAYWLHSPDLAERISHVGTYIRFENTLEPPVLELAVLTVARARDCQYVWSAHEPSALKAGVRPEAIEAVKNRTAPEGLTEHETLVFTYVNELLTNHRVPEATFAAALAWRGEQGIADLTATAGYYAMLTCALNAFVVLPTDRPALLPDAEY